MDDGYFCQYQLYGGNVLWTWFANGIIERNSLVIRRGCMRYDAFWFKQFIYDYGDREMGYPYRHRLRVFR